VRRVVITGLGCVGPAGVGVGPFQASLAGEGPRPPSILVETPRGRHRALRLAAIPPFHRQAFLPAGKLRRMGELSQLWVIACLLARSDAGWDSTGTSFPPPERRGIFLGTGFGCLDTTSEYLEGMFRDGAAMASPFLFAESVANAPAGHSAIELDARGANITLTCGDASAALALERGARWIRDGRLEMAWCGGVETMPQALLRVLARLDSPEFVGEGCASFLLETLEGARGRKAPIYAEIRGAALGSDPGALALEWSRDPEAISRNLRRALAACGREEPRPAPPIAKVFLHAPGEPLSDAAEEAALERILPGVDRVAVSRKTGTFAAAGGFSLAAAALEARSRSRGTAGEGSLLVSSFSWGGGLSALVFLCPGADAR
jgi:3-oxoacyl-(acyl-carrier-protein) synthase